MLIQSLRPGTSQLLFYCPLAKEPDKGAILSALGTIARVKAIHLIKFAVVLKTDGPVWENSIRMNFPKDKAQGFMEKVKGEAAEAAFVEFEYHDCVYTFGVVIPSKTVRLTCNGKASEEDVAAVKRLAERVVLEKL